MVAATGLAARLVFGDVLLMELELLGRAQQDCPKEEKLVICVRVLLAQPFFVRIDCREVEGLTDVDREDAPRDQPAFDSELEGRFHLGGRKGRRGAPQSREPIPQRGV